MKSRGATGESDGIVQDIFWPFRFSEVWQRTSFVGNILSRPASLWLTECNDFFFVEVKLPGDRLNKNQISFFRDSERFLNENLPGRKRAPYIAEGHWIELVRLRPE